MVRVIASTIAGALGICLAGSLFTANAQASSRMETVSFAKAPTGFIDFCRREPADCVASPNVRRVALNRQRFAEMDRLNREINKRVKPVTDAELYGRLEYWAIPKDQGDCEDYVLLKRRLLIERGWPSSALLITVVRDLKNEGHAVLTVAADTGDYILDNQRDDIRLWNQTGYRYVKRQSQTDPKIWVFVGDNARDAPITSTR
ncbi:transglutaminase-like cysteine peptidase [Terrihabitans sp. B22-R8]|uniref:transglutaminase-like cysteine peptidase n=1 Tax=Terrihabitans sp. B22-R8 TaxID=3425128 RepID=UPI00403D3D29